MNSQDFSTTILVDETPKQVFDAVNNVRAWWSGNIEGRTEKLDDEFAYQYKTVHRSRQKIVESVPEKKVVWLVTEAELNFVDDKNEWNGTKISFDISRKGDKTELRFTHHGLTSKFECYDACSNAWTDYINKSLHDLITKGKGFPNEKESGKKNNKQHA